MAKEQLKLNQTEIWGTVLFLNGVLIFVFSLVLTLGKSISDGTIWICLALFFAGLLLLTQGKTQTVDDTKEAHRES